MGKQSQLSQDEVQNVVQLSSKEKSSLEIARKLKGDHHTIKKFSTEGKVTHTMQNIPNPKH